MIISEDKGDSKYRIKTYSPGEVIINEDIYKKSLLVSRDQLVTNWPVNSIYDLSNDHLSVILSLKPALVLLGTGNSFEMPKPEQLILLYEHQIGVEAMDTGAACRTFMALIAEGRNVVAALIIH